MNTYSFSLTCEDDDYAIDHATETAIHELISSWNMEVVGFLFNNMDESRE
jgi:hypothetical protein